MDKRSSSESKSPFDPAGAYDPGARRSHKKTIIIVSFIAGFVALAAYLGPLMVSLCAITMAGVEVLSQDYTDAEEHLNFALQMNPHSWLAYQNRGELFSQLKKPTQAIADFTQALKYGGGSENNLGRGVEYHMLGQLPLALKDYDTYLNKNPKNPNALVNQSDAYYRLDDPQKSIAACNKAIAEDPRNSTALLNRSLCYVRMHKYKPAITDLKIALDNIYRQPGNPGLKRDCYLMRSIAYRALGETEEADSDLREARRAAHVHHKSTSEAKLFAAEFTQATSRRHFVLCSNLSEPEAEKSANRLEAFITYVDKNICHVRLDKNFRIFLFADQEKYKTFIRDKKLFPDDSTAEPSVSNQKTSRFDTSRDCVLTYSLTPFNDIVGSIMEKVAEDLPFADKWILDGLPALLAGCDGYSTTSECRLFLPNDAHCYSIPADIAPLSEIINSDIHAHEPSTARLAALFLFRTGKLKDYLNLSQSGEMSDFATTLEAVFSKRVPQIEPDWKVFVADLRKQSAISAGQKKPPEGKILASKEDFDKFSTANPELQLRPLDQLESQTKAPSSKQSKSNSTY